MTFEFHYDVQVVFDTARATPTLGVKPEYRDNELSQGQAKQLTLQAIAYSAEFPFQSAARLSSVSDQGAREWLEREVGTLGVDWRIVPQYPHMYEDTFFFKTKEQAVWFKLSFA